MKETTMSALPEQYQKYAAPTGQRPVYPASVELRGERPAVKWVPSAENPSVMVPVLAEYVQPAPAAQPRDLTPQPLINPGAQKILATGVGSGVALWGGGQFLAGAGQFVSALSGVGALLFFLALAGARAALMGGRGGTYIHHEQHTYVEQKWLGRTNIRNEQ